MSEHDPATFRATLEALIAASRFSEAAAYLKSADAAKQAAFDATGYLAVAGFAIRLPGLDDEVGSYDPNRDWLIPGTSDALESEAHMNWQNAATEFAREYNRARRGG